MKSTVSRSLRTRHSRVIPKISLCALRLLRFRPSSLPRFAASDDGHFVPGERLARPIGLSCRSRNHVWREKHGLETKRKAVGTGEVRNYSSGIMRAVASGWTRSFIAQLLVWSYDVARA